MFRIEGYNFKVALIMFAIMYSIIIILYIIFIIRFIIKKKKYPYCYSFLDDCIPIELNAITISLTIVLIIHIFAHFLP